MAIHPRFPVTPLLIRLVLIPAALVSLYFICPFPFDLIAVALLGFVLLKTNYLNKWFFAAGVVVWFAVAPYLFFAGNYNHVVILVCLGLIVYGCFHLSKPWGKKPWHPGVVLSATILYAAAGLCAIWVQRFEWVPYPKWCERTTVKASDYRLMKRIYQKPLPASFNIDQVRYYPYTFPAPDGPAPAIYEIKVRAYDYAALLANLKYEEAAITEQAVRNLQIFNVFKNSLFEQLWSAEVWDPNGRANELPKKVITINRSTMIVDERTSPALLVYVSTYLPYVTEKTN